MFKFKTELGSYIEGAIRKGRKMWLLCDAECESNDIWDTGSLSYVCMAKILASQYQSAPGDLQRIAKGL